MQTAVIASLAISLAGACQKTDSDAAGDIPVCIRQKIYGWERGIGFGAARVIRYPYRDGFVYYVVMRGDDFGNPLYDENCNQICVPDGGWDNGDGKCPTDFSKTNGEEIWRLK